MSDNVNQLHDKLYNFCTDSRAAVFHTPPPTNRNTSGKKNFLNVMIDDAYLPRNERSPRL